MDAARAAGMSDPDNNPNFRRRWSAPPLERERPATGGTVNGAKYSVDITHEQDRQVLAKLQMLGEVRP